MSEHGGEVTGLGTAGRYAEEMMEATAGQADGTAAFIASLTTGGVSGEVLDAALAAQQASDAAKVAWQRAHAELANHGQVGEAYAANPGAGDKEFVAADVGASAEPGKIDDGHRPGDRPRPHSDGDATTDSPSAPFDEEPDLVRVRRPVEVAGVGAAEADWMANDIAALTDQVDVHELLDRLLATAPTATAVTVVQRREQPATILDGRLVDWPGSAQGDQRPDNVVHLIYLMWISLDWRKATTASFLVSAAGFAVSLTLGSLALLLAGVSPLWAAGGGLLVAGGAAARALRYARRRGDQDPAAETTPDTDRL